MIYNHNMGAAGACTRGGKAVTDLDDLMEGFRATATGTPCSTICVWPPPLNDAFVRAAGRLADAAVKFTCGGRIDPHQPVCLGFRTGGSRQYERLELPGLPSTARARPFKLYHLLITLSCLSGLGADLTSLLAACSEASFGKGQREVSDLQRALTGGKILVRI